MDMIHAKELVYEYDKRDEEGNIIGTNRAIDGVDIDVPPGSFVAVLGHNGSGKSTLAKHMNAILVPTGGTMWVDGKDTRDPDELWNVRQSAGMVFQNPDNQIIGTVVEEDVGFGPENLGVPSDEIWKRVEDSLRAVGMIEYRKSSPNKLSGGQKQRVSMAGVMIDDVDILLFDEPLANLDPATGKRAIDLIDKISKTTGKTVLIIEHRLEDALYRDVDRIVVVGEGEIVADMKPDELLCTDVLEKEGIREPLYITALKHAGCTVKPETLPQHIESMELAPYREKVQGWFQKAELPPERQRTESMLEVEGVSFSYVPGKKVLQDINFRIEKGEMVSIVGKNGAGKSTLSNLICGFITPNSGKILLEGEDISGLSIKERGEVIGLVMQNPNQMISKPMIFDEVALGLAVRGVPEEEIKERVHETLKICGLYPFRNWPVSALSFGQKKRVTIASILVMNPRVLILDEPTAGQDFRHYTEIMEFLKDINERLGITIIMITHDMHLMLEYTDRAIVIADGRLIADDAPARVLTDSQIADRAYLKETSLYELAVKCGISDASGFVERFIHFEREERANG